MASSATTNDGQSDIRAGLGMAIADPRKKGEALERL
jgi:hypothetical protein